MLLHEHAAETEPGRDRRHLARVVGLHAADRDERVAPARERVRREVLELAHLVAAVREPGVAVLALGPDLDPAPEVLLEPLEPVHRRRPEEERHEIEALETHSVNTARVDPPSFTDVLEARRRIGPHLRPTPLYHYAGLSELVGADVWVKHENHQPTGAFKVRGGVNLVSRLDDDERTRGVICASTGNHGQSIAYAGRLFGVRAIVVVPESANPVKVAFIRAFGAEVVERGRNFDDARVHSEELAREHGYRYVHSGDEPDLIAGVATETLEILEERPDVDVVVVPIGGGSGAAGACIAAKAVDPAIEVIGVQSDAARSAYDSWRAGTLLDAENATFAEGLATGTAFELPQRILRASLDEFVLVSDDEIRSACLTMLERTRNLIEPAGASSLAAALKLRDRLAGRTVALVASGGNVSPAQLRELLRAEDTSSVKERDDRSTRGPKGHVQGLALAMPLRGMPGVAIV